MSATRWATGHGASDGAAPATRWRACATHRRSGRSITPTAGAITSCRSTSIAWLKIIAPETGRPDPRRVRDAGSRRGRPLRDRARAQAHLLERRPTVRPPVPRAPGTRDAADPGPRPGVQEEDVGDRRVGDESLRPAQHPIVAVANRRGGQRERARAGPGSVIPVAPMTLRPQARAATRVAAPGCRRRTAAPRTRRVRRHREHESVVARAVPDSLESRWPPAGRGRRHPLGGRQDALQAEGPRRPATGRGRTRRLGHAPPRPRPAERRRTQRRRGAGARDRRSTRSPRSPPGRAGRSVAPYRG